MRCLLAVLLLVAPAPAVAGGLEAGERGRVGEVIDGDTVMLAEGLEVRLVGIQAPKLPLGRPGFPTWPFAPEAKRRLEALVLGREVWLAYGGARRDRHGRALAHMFDGDERWIQGVLLSEGWARVYSFRDNRALVDEMLAIERAARAARRGIWSHSFYAVRQVTETPYLLNSFQLVEGRIEDAAVVRRRLYLNFGDDWRSDFTVTVGPRDLKAFQAAGLAPETWAGRRIRVRGWLKRFNGPMIEATHPEQIELLNEEGS